MRQGLAALCGAVVAAGITASAMAAEYGNGYTHASVVTRPDPGTHLNYAPNQRVPLGKRWVFIIPDLTGVRMSLPYIRHDPRLDKFEKYRVDRILPYQAELSIENRTPIYVPLYVDYRSIARPWTGGLDADHSIVRAQRLMKSLTTGSYASVIHNPRADHDASAAAERIAPRAVIHVPEGFRKQDIKPKPQKKAPVKKAPDKVALAD